MEIKGTKDGLLISLEDQDWSIAKKNLLEQITAKQEFFIGAQLILDVGNKILRTKEMKALREVLLEQKIVLKGILSESMVTRNSAESMGLITKIGKPNTIDLEGMKPLDTVMAGESAVFIHRTMRSGFKVAYHGHVVIVGDVNPGAEIISSGSIVVWGRLRGTVHAGAEGDETAIVCALDLSPMQLRIATKIATTPQDGQEPKPEIARIKDNQIIAEPWQQ
jgi:septum site-determining protein MinC